MKKFECPDGTTIEVRSENAVYWRSDTCQCVLVFEMDTLELDFPVEVCQEHKTVTRANLVSRVLNHNNTINEMFGNIDPTQDQKNTITKARKTEYDRIKAKGDPEIRTDATNKDATESDLRSKGR